MRYLWYAVLGLCSLGFLGLKNPDLKDIYDLTILNRVLEAQKLPVSEGF